MFNSQRAFCQEIQLEKLSTYENLNYRIANSNNINELLTTFEQNSIIYKNDNIVLSLRILSKLLKSSPSSQIESLPQDSRYLSLIEQVSQNIEQFNEEGKKFCISC